MFFMCFLKPFIGYIFDFIAFVSSNRIRVKLSLAYFLCFSHVCISRCSNALPARFSVSVKQTSLLSSTGPSKSCRRADVRLRQSSKNTRKILTFECKIEKTYYFMILAKF